MQTTNMFERKDFLNNFSYISLNFAENIAVYYVRGFMDTLGISYAELNRLSEELSCYFLKVFEQGIKFIGVAVSDYLFVPCLILGLWKSGKSFVGAASQYSEKSTIKYLNFLSVKYVIADTKDKYEGQVVFEFCIYNQKFFILKREVIDNGVEHPNVDICFGIMTSGSTGEPKIIRVPWSCILPNALELSEEFQVNDCDCIFQASPYTFDPFFIEFFMAVLKGCSLLIVSSAIKLCSADLLQILFTTSETDFINTQLDADDCKNNFHINIQQVKRPSVSIIQMTPSFFNRWTHNEIREIILSSKSKLRVLILGGEKFPNEILALKSPENKTKIFNIYGITEISCWAFLNNVTSLSSDCEVTLGRPLKDIEYNISKNGEFNIMSKTRTCLVDDEFSLGTPTIRNSGDIVKISQEQIYYVGRKNQIVKKYGIKINLIKVEDAFLKANKSIKSCCCVYDERNMKLGLFYVPEKTKGNYLLITYEDFVINGYQIPKEEIYDSEIPDYLIEVSELPLNLHGKCNRRKLQLRLKEIHRKRKPELEVESTFHKIWREVLGLEKADLLSGSFTQLGGNSVLALDLVNKLEDASLKMPRNFISELLNGGNYESCLKCLKAVTDSETDCKKVKVDLDDTNVDFKLSVRWKFDLEKCVDATPTLFTYQGKERVVVGSHSRKLSCLDLESGSEIWTIFLGDRIECGFRVSQDNKRGFIGCYDHFVYCIDLSDGSVIWKFKTGDVIKSMPSIATNGKTVYVASYDKHLYCLSEVDGTLLGKLQLSNGGVYSTGTIDDSLAAFYIGTLDGICVAVNQESNQIKWKTVLKSPVFASPCVIPGKFEILFIEVLGVVHCLNAGNGTKIWAYEADGNIYSSPIIQQINGLTTIIFGCHDHHLYCLQHGHAPELKWKQQLDSAVFTKPSIFFHWFVCTATKTGFIYLCDLTSGKIKSRLKLNGEVFSSPIIGKDSIIVGCRDNNVYSFNISFPPIKKD